jgi:hypothetical protein
VELVDRDMLLASGHSSILLHATPGGFSGDELSDDV